MQKAGMSAVNNKAICEIISSLINFKTFIVKILKYNHLKRVEYGKCWKYWNWCYFRTSD